MNDIPTTTRQIVLASRPQGEPTAENFRLEDAPLPDLQDGQVLVRTSLMSVDPYMRGRMNDVKSYVPPFQVDQPLTGHAVGTVIASRSDDLPVGTEVTHFNGWREHTVLDADDVTRVDTEQVGQAPYLGVLGMPGLTAYAGLFHVGEFAEGDTVFVSGAAGAVGSLVGQMAKLAGAGRVVGSAGSPEKLERLRQLGFDAVINYKNGDLGGQLREAAPDGIDLYFDNVGGDHLEAALSRMNTHGRVVMCGAISQYNATEPPPGPATSPWRSASASPCAASSWAPTTTCAPSSCSASSRGSRTASWTGTSPSAPGWRTPRTPSSSCSPAATPARWSSASDPDGVNGPMG